MTKQHVTNAINFGKTYTNTSNEEVDVIMHVCKSVLFYIPLSTTIEITRLKKQFPKQRSNKNYSSTIIFKRQNWAKHKKNKEE